MTIPVGKAHIAAEPSSFTTTAVTQKEFLKAAARVLPDDAQARKSRILWAGDAEMRAYVSGTLDSRFDVHAVPDGKMALEAARAHPPDLILSDIMMPRLAGLDLLYAVRADSQLREIPVILLSARATEESGIQGLEAGADDYLVKPFSARELVARVERQIKVSRMRQEAKEAALRESEDRFRIFANTAPAILWITDPDGSCTFVSRGWFDYTRQTEEAALGFGWLDVVHPDDREAARRAILDATRNREAFSLDLRLRCGDGEYRWSLNTGRPRFRADDVFGGLTGSVIDIHERKQSAQSSALLSAIVDCSDDAIISKDLSGIIMSWNKGAERLFGYSAEEAVGRSIAMLIPNDRLEEEPQILERLKRGERVDHFETIRVRKDGTPLNISVTISPVKDADGRIFGASNVTRDITERVRHEQELKEANASLKRANADLQQFAYSASHDLQEPLRMVAAYSELLQQKFEGKLGPAADDYIRYTVSGAMRMQTLLRDLRAYMQVSAVEQRPQEEVDAREVLDKALSNLEVAIRESAASISCTALPRVRMYAFELEQIFQNLIANAICYRSAAPPRIQVAAERQGDEWLFSVQDNGIGIDPKFKEQIFGIFKRLHSAAEYPGTGMGLAICERIVKRSGGRIWVESEPGRGSTFFFAIPSGKGERRAAERESVFDPPDRGQPGRRRVGA